jgi:hypothetical protein
MGACVAYAGNVFGVICQQVEEHGASVRQKLRVCVSMAEPAGAFCAEQHASRN